MRAKKNNIQKKKAHVTRHFPLFIEHILARFNQNKEYYRISVETKSIHSIHQELGKVGFCMLEMLNIS
jgi:hypothetical protein